MKKEQLFEVLGELDEALVERALEPAEKKKAPQWRAWGAMAACLCLVIGICAYVRLFPRTNGDTSCDIAPMIYVNDTLYQMSGNPEPDPKLKAKFIYLGKIESEVSSGNVPTENFQANDPIVGSEVYQYGQYLLVQIDGTCWLYQKYGEQETNRNDLTEAEREEREPDYHTP